ncbi:MAG: hypothetical protein K1V95_02260 [Eubacterium sp.]
MYPYHNRIKQRIKNGELIGYDYTENYKNSGARLLLYFSSPPFVRPINPSRYAEYKELLKNSHKN